MSQPEVKKPVAAPKPQASKPPKKDTSEAAEKAYQDHPKFSKFKKGDKPK